MWWGRLVMMSALASTVVSGPALGLGAGGQRPGEPPPKPAVTKTMPLAVSEPVPQSADAATHTTVVTTAQVATPHETVIVNGQSTCSVEQPDGTRTLSLDCLNAYLSDLDAVLQDAPALKALDAAGRGNPEALGTFSFTASQIRRGKNFGHSVYPERPTPPSYTNGLLPKGGK